VADLTRGKKFIMIKKMNSFGKRQAVSDGWHLFWQNWKLLLLVVITIVVVQILSSVFSSLFSGDLSYLNILLLGIFFLVGGVLTLGSMSIYLSLVDGKPVSYNDLFSQWNLLGWYILGGILVFVLTLVGYVFLIIPGIILSIRLQFWMYLCIDKRIGAVAAIGKSWEITKRNTGNLFWFALLLGGVMILGMLALGVGVFVAMPVVSLATARMYRALSPKESSVVGS